MRYLAARAFFVVLLAACFQFLSIVQTSLRIDETAVRIRFDRHTTVILPVLNATSHPVTARVKLELLDPHGSVRANGERNGIWLSTPSPRSPPPVNPSPQPEPRLRPAPPKCPYCSTARRSPRSKCLWTIS